jgi:predicted transcriptional regulator
VRQKKRKKKVDRNKVIELRKKGMKLKDIAKKLGVSYCVVCYHLNPKYRKKILEHVKKWKMEKYRHDEKYREKEKERLRENALKYYRKKSRDPEWFEKYRKKKVRYLRMLRKKKPIIFNKMMARCYIRKLPKREIKKLFSEFIK